MTDEALVAKDQMKHTSFLGLDEVCLFGMGFFFSVNVTFLRSQFFQVNVIVNVYRFPALLKIMLVLNLFDSD